LYKFSCKRHYIHNVYHFDGCISRCAIDPKEQKTMIEIRIYGKLRRFISEPEADHSNVMRVTPQPQETLAQVLARIGIPLDDIYTIFLNSRLLVTRSKMAYWIRFQQVHKNPLDWELGIVVKSGDRVGLFGRDMAALVI
jgi:hypothetical protein